MRTTFSPILWVLVAFPTIGLAVERVIFVNHAAAGKNTGTSWHDAYADLQDALAEVESLNRQPFEIWVAEGTYKPDRGTGDRFASFRLLSEVAILGGFVGGETECEERDPILHEVILSGDLNGDDLAGPNETNPCCDSGPGIDCEVPECKARVCEFEPICCAAWLQYCEDYAEILCCELCRPSRCDKSLHVVSASDANQNAVIDSLTIADGEANDLEFIPSSGRFGGGLSCVYPNPASPDLTVRNCRFTNNAGSQGSALYAVGGDITLQNSTFSENYSFGKLTTAAVVNTQEHLSISGCLFENNRGGGLSYYATETMHRCSFINNDGPGLYLRAGSGATILGSQFVGNKWRGLYFGGNGTIQVANSTFLGNSTIQNGAAAYLDSLAGGMIFVNCVFSGNYAYDPSPVHNARGGAFVGNGIMLNCVFSKNWAEGSIGAVGGDALTIANSIFRGNIAGSGTVQDQQIVVGVTSTPNINYNSIEGLDGSFGGMGNVDVDPLFVDADGPDGVSGTLDDDFHLLVQSPLIDAGDPDPPLAPYLDLDGHARILCGRIDMGAYEFGIGDYDCDRVVELSDFMAFPACLTGPNAGPYANWCEAFDFHAEIADRIDLLDFAGLQNDH